MDVRIMLGEVPLSAPPFEDIYGLHSLLNALVFNSNLILSGPKGIGKSLAVMTYAVEHKVPLIVVDCSEDLRETHLYGSFVLEGDQTPYVAGPIPQAIETANAEGRCILLFEELNTLTPQAQKLLNPLTDWRKSVRVPRANRTFTLQPDAKLSVLATMNDASYGGTYTLNEDLKSRFDIVPLTYPDMAAERRLVVKHGSYAEDVREKVLALAKETRIAGAVDHALSPREVVQLLDNMTRMPADIALRLLLGKYEGAHRATIAARIQAVFGASVS